MLYSAAESISCLEALDYIVYGNISTFSLQMCHEYAPKRDNYNLDVIITNVFAVVS